MATIPLISFEPPEFADGDFVAADHARFRSATPSLDGVVHSGSGAQRVDAHTAHSAGLVVDSSSEGHEMVVEETDLGSPDHAVEMRPFTDSGAGEGEWSYVYAALRCSNNGSSAVDCYQVGLNRNGDSDTFNGGAIDTSFVRIHRVVAGDALELCAYQAVAGLNGLEAPTMRCEAVGDIITVTHDSILLLTHDTNTDVGKITSGNFIGAGVWRKNARNTFQPWYTDLYAESVGAPSVGGLKYWDGTRWTSKPMKYWDGSAWVTAPVKYWDGSSWVTA